MHRLVWASGCMQTTMPHPQPHPHPPTRACVHACVRVRVRACVCARVRACVCSCGLSPATIKRSLSFFQVGAPHIGTARVLLVEEWKTIKSINMVKTGRDVLLYGHAARPGCARECPGRVRPGGIDHRVEGMVPERPPPWQAGQCCRGQAAVNSASGEGTPAGPHCMGVGPVR